jgi:hypothetical protein
MIALRISSDLATELQAEAKSVGKPMRTLIRELLVQHVAGRIVSRASIAAADEAEATQ